MRRWRGLLVLAAVLVVAGLLLAACGSSGSSSSSGSPSAAGTPKAGGTYNYPLASDPVAIDPVTAYEDQGMQVEYQVFQGLVVGDVDAQGNLVAKPQLAESWDTTDNQTYTFHLKQGVMFAPPVSREVTAQDFVDSWNYVTNPKNQSPVSYILAPIKGVESSGYQSDVQKGVTGVKALDKYTLRVTLQYPFADFINSLMHPVSWVMPVDYLNKVGYKAFSQKPVGTGPYMVQSWTHKRSVELVKNPELLGQDAMRATWTISTCRSSSATSSPMWLAFQKGDLDYSYVPSGQIRAAQNMPQVKSGEWAAKGWPQITTVYIGFNMKDKLVGGSQGLTIRKAMYYASDAQSVINIMHEGQAVPATGIIPPGHARVGRRPEPLQAEPARPGEADPGQHDGADAQLLVQHGRGQPEDAEIAAGRLEAGRDQRQPRNFEWATFLDKVSKGQGQVYRQGWIADYPSLDNFLYPLFQSQQPPYSNMCFYNNPKFDDMLAQARGTADAQQRYDLYHQAEKLLLTDAPVIPLVLLRDFRVDQQPHRRLLQRPAGLHQHVEGLGQVAT